MCFFAGENICRKSITFSWSCNHLYIDLFSTFFCEKQQSLPTFRKGLEKYLVVLLSALVVLSGIGANQTALLNSGPFVNVDGGAKVFANNTI